MEPVWLQHARTHIGLAETPGPSTAPTIASWLKSLKAWWTDDETPWCGTFVAHCMQATGNPIPKYWMRAKAWIDWGKPCPAALGCVCILDREGGGHVFFPTKISRNFVWGIGGNQGNRVQESKFPRARVLGFRWPLAQPTPMPMPLSDDGGGSLSTGEA